MPSSKNINFPLAEKHSCSVVKNLLKTKNFLMSFPGMLWSLVIFAPFLGYGEALRCAPL
jgi:hypothetical protein